MLGIRLRLPSAALALVAGAVLVGHAQAPGASPAWLDASREPRRA
jgi:hypothetical protein